MINIVNLEGPVRDKQNFCLVQVVYIYEVSEDFLCAKHET